MQVLCCYFVNLRIVPFSKLSHASPVLFWHNPDIPMQVDTCSSSPQADRHWPGCLILHPTGKWAQAGLLTNGKLSLSLRQNSFPISEWTGLGSGLSPTLAQTHWDLLLKSQLTLSWGQTSTKYLNNKPRTRSLSALWSCDSSIKDPSPMCQLYNPSSAKVKKRKQKKDEAMQAKFWPWDIPYHYWKHNTQEIPHADENRLTSAEFRNQKCIIRVPMKEYVTCATYS